MWAMVLVKAREPLQRLELSIPTVTDEQLLLRVRACGVCRTDLHIVDGELSQPKLPLILGHQIVGEVVEIGNNVHGFSKVERVGVPWLAYTCGHCDYCQTQQENLCDNALFTGYTLDGGYAEYTVANADYCFHLPQNYDDVHLAPLLCGGLIGYRAYRLAGNAKRLGLYGFGSAAHLLTQVAVFEGKEVYAFTRPGDTATQSFARSLGATWAGDSDTLPPEPLEAAIIFAPAGALVPTALKAVRKGGVVVCGGIHMSDIPSFPYALLWEERVIRSVANLTREDGQAFFKLAARTTIHANVNTYALEQANTALEDLRRGRIEGSAVLIP